MAKVLELPVSVVVVVVPMFISKKEISAPSLTRSNKSHLYNKRLPTNYQNKIKTRAQNRIITVFHALNMLK